MNAEKLKEVLSEHAKWLADLLTGKRAHLSGADLRGADLSGADLSGADLRSAHLRSAHLRSAHLSGADLRGADLSGADLSGADLSGADLSGALNLYTIATPPERGPFLAYKKCRGGVVLELEILGARTGSYIGRKCRAESARVVTAFHHEPGQTEFVSMHDPTFKYRVGEVVKVENYDPDPRVECALGVHFFMTRKEAEAYT